MDPPFYEYLAVGGDGVKFLERHGGKTGYNLCTKYEDTESTDEYMEPSLFEKNQWVHKEKSRGPTGGIAPTNTNSNAYIPVTDDEGIGIICLWDEIWFAFSYFSAKSSENWTTVWVECFFRPRKISRLDLLMYMIKEKCCQKRCFTENVSNYPCEKECVFPPSIKDDEEYEMPPYPEDIEAGKDKRIVTGKDLKTKYYGKLFKEHAGCFPVCVKGGKPDPDPDPKPVRSLKWSEFLEFAVAGEFSEFSVINNLNSAIVGRDFAWEMFGRGQDFKIASHLNIQVDTIPAKGAIIQITDLLFQKTTAKRCGEGGMFFKCIGTQVIKEFYDHFQEVATAVAKYQTPAEPDYIICFTFTNEQSQPNVGYPTVLYLGRARILDHTFVVNQQHRLIIKFKVYNWLFYLLNTYAFKYDSPQLINDLSPQNAEPPRPREDPPTGDKPPDEADMPTDSQETTGEQDMCTEEPHE